MTASTKSFMTFSVTNMETEAGENVPYLDSAWEEQGIATTASQSSSGITTRSHRPSGKTFESYAAATVSDQVSGMTEPE